MRPGHRDRRSNDAEVIAVFQNLDGAPGAQDSQHKTHDNGAQGNHQRFRPKHPHHHAARHAHRTHQSKFPAAGLHGSQDGVKYSQNGDHHHDDGKLAHRKNHIVPTAGNASSQAFPGQGLHQRLGAFPSVFLLPHFHQGVFPQVVLKFHIADPRSSIPPDKLESLMSVFLFEPAFIGNRQSGNKTPAAHAHSAGLGQPVPAGEGNYSRHLPGFSPYGGPPAPAANTNKGFISGTTFPGRRINQHQVIPDLQPHRPCKRVRNQERTGGFQHGISLLRVSGNKHGVEQRMAPPGHLRHGNAGQYDGTVTHPGKTGGFHLCRSNIRFIHVDGIHSGIPQAGARHQLRNIRRFELRMQEGNQGSGC